MFILLEWDTSKVKNYSLKLKNLNNKNTNKDRNGKPRLLEILTMGNIMN